VTDDSGTEPRGRPTPGDASPARLNTGQRLASMTGRNAFMALQMGATLFATAGGLVFYLILTSVHVNNILALLLGLGFALLARQAATSLLLEWLLARAQRAARRAGAPPGPPASGPRR
jgi:hypothetical protein